MYRNSQRHCLDQAFGVVAAFIVAVTFALIAAVLI